MADDEDSGSDWRTHVENAIEEIQKGHEKAQDGDTDGFGFHVGVAHSELKEALHTGDSR